MSLPTRHVFLGLVLGATAATALGAIGPGYVATVFADEAPAGFDTDNLVKFDDREYRIDYQPWVSTDPVSTAKVKKIEAGRVTTVSISTTSTGTYSTDGLTSRHVQYPGIDVEEVSPGPRFWFAKWSGGRWMNFSTHAGKSFVFIGR